MNQQFDRINVIKDFSRVADVYDQHAAIQKKVAEKLFGLALPYIKGTSIVDLGAGTGSLAALSKSNLPDKKIIALDISLNMCKSAITKADASVNADISNLPFKSNYYDTAFSSLVFQWVREPSSAIMEVLRILSNNGIFAFSVFTDGTLKELSDSFDYINEKKRVNSFLKLYDYSEIITKSGFQILLEKEEKTYSNHDTIYDLFHSIKQVGGSNKYPSRLSYLGRNKIHTTEDYYRKNFEENNKLSASWHIGYLIAKKAL